MEIPKKEFSYTDLSKHATKGDLYLAIHDQVFDVTTFIDEHPGGEEVLLDVAGQDATEPFEDVGHSDEAREMLYALLVGVLKHQPDNSSSSALGYPVRVIYYIFH
jgi:cytochrome b involved in lipid metabolism